MSQDPFAEFKNRQREMWSTFAPTAMFTTPVAGQLVRFAQIEQGESVLDVGTGTGVVAVTAARRGARVTGLDLTPELIEAAGENARIAGLEDIVWTEGDAENLPYADASFDVVLSQFGHMFAPRPEVAIAEMRRVLKPGGRIAFATWPPEDFVGRMFAFIGRNSPPPPAGASPPPQWGNPGIVAERLGPHFEAPFFGRGTMRSTSGWVRAARPGPISTIGWPGSGAMALTMDSMMPPSAKKCWPKRLRAMCFMQWPSSLRCFAVFDVGPAPQLLHPGGEGFLDLLFAHRVACHVPLLALGELGLAALDQLDQVHAKTRHQGLADVAGLERIHGLLELGHVAARIGPAQIAALLGAAIL